MKCHEERVTPALNSSGGLIYYKTNLCTIELMRYSKLVLTPMNIQPTVDTPFILGPVI